MRVADRLHSTGALWSTAVPHKGRRKYAQVGAAMWLKSFGRSCMILHSATEISLMTLVYAMWDLMISETPGMRITTRRSPSYSKRSTGAAEVSNDSIGGRVRMLLHQVKMQTSEVATFGNYLLVWAARHVARACNRFARRTIERHLAKRPMEAVTFADGRIR